MLCQSSVDELHQNSRAASVSERPRERDGRLLFFAWMLGVMLIVTVAVLLWIALGA
jgi:cytoskeletal protein RodZ